MADELLRWRSEFPILETSTYLVSHSMGAMPRAAVDWLGEYANGWQQEGISVWERWLPFFQETSGLVGQFLQAEPGSVVMHQNVSALFNTVLSCFDFAGSRNKIVYPELTFPTLKYNIRTRKRLGAQPVEVPSPDGIRQPVEGFLSAIDHETLLVVLDHGIYRSGALIEVTPIVEAAHQQGAQVVVDAYQTVGVVPINVQLWQADFVVAGSHKWLCGGPGAAFLYVRPDRLLSCRPHMMGWFSQERPFDFADEIDYAQSSRRFLGGTPGIPALYAARAGYEILLQVGVERIREKNVRLCERLIAGADTRGLRVHTPRGPIERGGMVCIDFAGAAAAEPELVRRRFFVDYRPRCGLRISPHFYTREDEIDMVLEEIDRIRSGKA
jgi:kynureninase